MKSPVDLQSIFNKYRDLCYGFFIKIHGDRELAKDLTQDIFVRLLQSKNDLNEIKNWDKYIYLMCRNRAYDHFKKMNHEKKYKSYLTNYYDQPSNTVRSNAELQIDAEHYGQVLERSLDQLPDQQKIIFNLSKREGLSHDKIAEKLNLSPITVRNHLHRAMKNIRASINVDIDLIILVFTFSSILFME